MRFYHIINDSYKYFFDTINRCRSVCISLNLLYTNIVIQYGGSQYFYFDSQYSVNVFSFMVQNICIFSLLVYKLSTLANIAIAILAMVFRIFRHMEVEYQFRYHSGLIIREYRIKKYYISSLCCHNWYRRAIANTT